MWKALCLFLQPIENDTCINLYCANNWFNVLSTHHFENTASTWMRKCKIVSRRTHLFVHCCLVLYDPGGLKGLQQAPFLPPVWPNWVFCFPSCLAMCLCLHTYDSIHWHCCAANLNGTLWVARKTSQQVRCCNVTYRWVSVYEMNVLKVNFDAFKSAISTSLDVFCCWQGEHPGIQTDVKPLRQLIGQAWEAQKQIFKF